MTESRTILAFIALGALFLILGNFTGFHGSATRQCDTGIVALLYCPPAAR